MIPKKIYVFTSDVSFLDAETPLTRAWVSLYPHEDRTEYTDLSQVWHEAKEEPEKGKLMIGIEEDDLSDNNSTEPHRGKDEKWIEQLSQQIKEHWDEERLFQENNHEKMMKKTTGKENNVEDKKEQSLKKQISRIEEHNRRFREEHPEFDSSSGWTAYCEQ